MATEIFWNEAAPPTTQAEHRAAEWLMMISRAVGLTAVTSENKPEWVWRFAFTQEMAGRRWHDYRIEIDKFATVLERFLSATLSGRVWEQDRDEFVREHVDARVECAEEQADGATEHYHEHATA